MIESLIATASYDRTIRFWDVDKEDCLRVIPCKESQVNRVAFSGDGKYLVAAGNPNIRIYEVDGFSSEEILLFSGHTSNVTSVGFHNSFRWMYSASEDNTVKIWDLNVSGYAQEFVQNTMINCAALHPNQAEIVIGLQDGSIKAIDLTSASIIDLLSYENNNSPIRSVSISPDGKIVIGATSDGHCYIYSLPNQDFSVFKLETQFEAYKRYILKTAFNSDGSLVVTSSAEETIKIWDTRDWTLKKTLFDHSQWIWDVAFSINSTYIFSAASDKMARLWNINRGDTMRIYRGHTGHIVTIALNTSSQSMHN